MVGSKHDPAYKAATLLAAGSEGRVARVLVAGRAKTCSQKIHNILMGLKVQSEICYSC